MLGSFRVTHDCFAGGLFVRQNIRESDLHVKPEPLKDCLGTDMIVQGNIPGTRLVVNVSTSGGVITSVEPADRRTTPDRGGPDLFICQGFFDPQVNGYAGVDFNGKDLTGDRLHHAARSLAASGVTRFLPTLITASHERLLRQLAILDDALENDPSSNGVSRNSSGRPYISAEDGPGSSSERFYPSAQLG